MVNDSMEYLLGIDVGTSGTKTVLFDTEGRALARATVPASKKAQSSSVARLR